MRVAISGCRPPWKLKQELRDKWDTPENRQIYASIIENVIRVVGSFPESSIVVHGGAMGVDLAAKAEAEKRNLKTEEHLPDYEKFGSKAPLIRNEYVLTVDEAHFFPAPWSRGTNNAISLIENSGIRYFVHKVEK